MEREEYKNTLKYADGQEDLREAAPINMWDKLAQRMEQRGISSWSITGGDEEGPEDSDINLPDLHLIT